MAQASINIRTDENLKQQFDYLCEQLGLNITTAFNIFMKAAVRDRCIPVELSLKSQVKKPLSLTDMTKEEFNTRFNESYNNAKNGVGRPAEEVFADLQRKYEI